MTTPQLLTTKFNVVLLVFLSFNCHNLVQNNDTKNKNFNFSKIITTQKKYEKPSTRLKSKRIKNKTILKNQKIGELKWLVAPLNNR